MNTLSIQKNLEEALTALDQAKAANGIGVEHHSALHERISSALQQLDKGAEQQVNTALGLLSHSEQLAVTAILKELQGNEGAVVTSRLADGLEISRSIFVDAIRKLELSGLVEARSLGMKGTYIKLLNTKLRERLH